MNLSINWVLRVRNDVYKKISKFPKQDRERLLVVIENLRLNPYAGDIEKMKGEENVWRRRIGSYRIRFELIISEKVVYVFLVERRTSSSY